MYKITMLNDYVYYVSYYGHITFDTIYVYPQNRFLDLDMIKSIEEVK